MKIKTDDIIDVSIGVSSENNFKLNQNSGILYEILRSKMYKNPIKAVVREIASNSRDANRAAGKKNVPIKVYFDLKEDMILEGTTLIHFEDCGLGMNPDIINDVYLTYGESNKRNSDELTGGWGLGAKTPFAMCEMFEIVTICDYKGERRKYHYVASIDKTNKGKLSLINESMTNEDTGTTISIPIESKLESQFREACNFYFKYWDIPIEGFYHKEDSKADLFFIENGDISKGELRLLIDNIIYDVDFKEFGIEFINLLEQSIKPLNISLFLKFNTEEIEVQPSREGIRVNDANIKIIKDRLTLFISNSTEIFKEHIKNCGGVLKMIKDNYQFYGFIRKNTVFIENIYLKNIILNLHHKKPLPKIKFKRSYSNGKISYYQSREFLIHLSNEYRQGIYILTKGNFKYKRNIQAILKQNDSVIIDESIFDTNEGKELMFNISNLYPEYIKYDFEYEDYKPSIRKRQQSKKYSYILKRGFISKIESTNEIKPNDLVLLMPTLKNIEIKDEVLKFIDKEVIILNSNKYIGVGELINKKHPIYKEAQERYKLIKQMTEINFVINSRFQNNLLLYMIFEKLPTIIKKYIDIDRLEKDESLYSSKIYFYFYKNYRELFNLYNHNIKLDTFKLNNKIKKLLDNLEPNTEKLISSVNKYHKFDKKALKNNIKIWKKK